MQLRPHIANFELSAESSRGITHSLDISLFERLCVSSTSPSSATQLKFPLTQLTVQRRMRPEIADMVRMPLYKELIDHVSVSEYPPVMGVYYNLYWFDHSNYEDRESENALDMNDVSHSNTFEVEMTVQFVSHLYKQGCYKGGDITIITPYLGQLRKLRNSLRNTFAVEISERDKDDLEDLESMVEEQEPVLMMERKPLSESVRIATVHKLF
jgi:superfamily I DNA and/or RNA helicase